MNVHCGSGWMITDMAEFFHDSFDYSKIRRGVDHFECEGNIYV